MDVTSAFDPTSEHFSHKQAPSYDWGAKGQATSFIISTATAPLLDICAISGPSDLESGSAAFVPFLLAVIGR
ncbi:uncharacterized [Tachysurus ichikawai]